MGANTSGASELGGAPEPLIALLGLMPDSAILVAGSGQILGANARARSVLELDGTARGVLLAELTADPDAARAFLRLCARTTQAIPGALRLHDADRSGSSYYAAAGALVATRTATTASIIAVRFWPRDVGNPFILLTQKVAELNEEVRRRREAEEALRASEAALREHARELESASIMKDEFLATVSHELRTPLNAILGWSVMLRTGLSEPAAADRAIATIERNARAQSQLIDDLLDVSRIVTGKVRLDVHQFDPILAVDAALDAMRPAAEAKGIRVQSVLDPGAGLVMGDPARIQQVLWNLLSNAVKFTPKGGRIQVVLRSVESSVEIEVIDTGIGISAEFLAHVFAPFRQQDGSSTRNHGGLGLGLAITKNLVELHGGTIAVLSDGAHRGTRVRVRLPRSALRVGPTPERHELATLSALPLDCPQEIVGLRLVVVDDEPDSLALITTFFERCGATVATASNAVDGLALIVSERPDAIVSDIGMPEMDGYELIRRVRALGSDLGGRVPAVALTAYARSEDRTSALRAGFDSHLTKPVEPRELLAVVARIVARR